MIKPVSFTEKLLFSTIRIEALLADGQRSVGTAFFFDARLDENRHLPLIVTNKHVVKDAVEGIIQLHEAEGEGNEIRPSGRHFEARINNFAGHWIGHPNESIDLCAMPFQPMRDKLQKNGKRIFNLSFDESLVFSDLQLETLSAVENVLMVGYPTGLWDEKNNLPLFRRGITSTHPAIDFCGKPIFLIDAAAFPGSSGSPVVFADMGFYQDKMGNTSIGTSRIALLGVLYAGPMWTAEGSVEVDPIPTAVLPMSRTNVMIHLGYVLKAKEILALSSHIVREANKGLLRDKMIIFRDCQFA